MNKKNLTIVGFIVIAAILLLVLANMKLLPLSIGGASTLSLQQANLQSSSPYFSGKVWLLTFRTGGLGQSYFGTFTPADVDGVTPDSTRTTKTFSLDVESSNTFCKYPIRDTSASTPIRDIQYKEFSCPTSYLLPYVPSDSETTSKSGIQNLLYKGKYTGYTCFAIGYSTQAPVGTFPTVPASGTEYSIVVDIDGQRSQKTINTLTGSTQGAIGDSVYGIWQGDLGTGKTCESSSGFNPTLYKAGYVNGAWRAISKASYDSYTSAYSTDTNALQQFVFNSNPDKNQINYYVNDLQSKANVAKLSQSVPGSFIQSNSLTNGELDIILQSPITFPVTTLYIKADAIGIYTPVPDVRILSAQSSCFQTGENGVVSVTLENRGTERGTATVSLQCSSPFSFQSNQEVSFNAGETKTINLAVTGSSIQETYGSCGIKAEGVFGIKTSTVNTCVKPQITCTRPYPQTFCGIESGLETVRQCSQSGSQTITLQRCTATQTCDAQQGKCIDKESASNGGSGSTCGFVCNLKNFFGKLGDLLTLIKVAVLSAVTLFSLFFTKAKIEDLLPKNKGAAWAIALLLAAGTGISLYAVLFTDIFWIVAGASFIFFVILKFIPLRGLLR